MDFPILTTKLHTPSSRPGSVQRMRLIEKLELGLSQNHKLSLIAASAGYGKTTLVTQWLDNNSGKYVWLSIDEGDNDINRFLSYFIAGLQEIDDDIGQSLFSVLGSIQVLPPEGLFSVLIDEIAGLASPVIVVLDDYHSIHNEKIHAGLDYLLKNQLDNLHLVLISRFDPPLSLARLRVREQLTEIRSLDLRFMLDETIDFFRDPIDLDLNRREIEILLDRTEGWAAGLQLAGLSLRGRNQEQIAGFLESFGGKHRDVVDYLSHEVLSQQSSEILEFVTCTSIFDRFCVPLCNSILEIDDSASLLMQMETANLFLIPLDEQREWYRYHFLFRDLAASKLDENSRHTLYRKATNWFEENGLVEEAVKYALLAGDADQAARLVSGVAEATIKNGYLSTMRRWLDELPDDLVRSDGGLAITKAWILIFTGMSDAAGSFVDSAEESYRKTGDQAGVGRVLTARCKLIIEEKRFTNEKIVDEISRLSSRALELIGEDDYLYRGFALIISGGARLWLGDSRGAEESLTEALAFGENTSQPAVVSAALSDLVSVLNLQGQREKAARVCRSVMAKQIDSKGNPLPISAIAYLQLGSLEYLANHLEEAARLNRTALDLCSSHGWLTLITACEMEKVSLHLAGQEPEKAFELLQKNLGRAQESGSISELVGWRQKEAEFHLRQGTLEVVEKWAEELDIEVILDFLTDCFREIECFTYIRYQIARNNLPEALRIVNAHLKWAADVGYVYSLINNHIIRARIDSISGNRNGAVASLEKALKLAAPGEYRRPFLDEDLPLTELLPKTQNAQSSFVSSLMHDARREFSSSTAEITASSAGFARSKKILTTEPLSDREREILELISAGLSNREIADRLFIALSTVKTHINNIYSKLDVKSRTKALARAGELDLL